MNHTETEAQIPQGKAPPSTPNPTQPEKPVETGTLEAQYSLLLEHDTAERARYTETIRGAKLLEGPNL